MRGIDSIAKAVTPRELRRSIPSLSVSGWRKPISTWPSRSLPTSSSLGLRTLATRSAAHGSPIAAPASVNASSVNEAAAPAPCSTTTSIPSSFDTRSGTRATLRSPAAVSFGTPTFMEGELYEGGNRAPSLKSRVRWEAWRHSRLRSKLATRTRAAIRRASRSSRRRWRAASASTRSGSPCCASARSCTTSASSSSRRRSCSSAGR